MKLHHLVFSAILATGVAACGSDSTEQPKGVGTVRGALEDPALASNATSVTVSTVNDDGTLEVVAEGDVTADGKFSIDEVPGGDGPFVLRVIGAGDTTLAAVIVPDDIDDEDVVRTARVGVETTAEVMVMQSLLQGERDVADIDSVGLMVWLTGDLVAKSNNVDLAQAVGMGQDAWMATVTAEGESTTFVEVEDAKLDLWAAYTASLDAAATESQRAEARNELIAGIAADIAGDLDLDAGTQSDAEAAAGLVFSTAFQGSEDARFEAEKIATMLSAHASWAVQRESIEGSTVENEVAAKLEAAYEPFITAIDRATGAATIDNAAIVLTGAITGRGGIEGSTSALSVLVAAENDGDDFAAQASVDAALDATAENSLALQASIDNALAGGMATRADAVATAYAAFRSDVEASVTTSLGSSISTRVNAFTSEAAAQSGGHLAALLDLGVQLFDFGPGVTVAGIVEIGLGATTSADGAIALDGLDTTFDATANATVAVLSSVTNTGALIEVARGTVDAANHRFVFQQITEASGDFVVELRDAQGGIRGAMSFSDTNASGHLRDVGALTHESTVETRVMLERFARLEAPSMIDGERLDAFVDAAVAGSVVSDDDIATLATATMAAEIAATGRPDAARAHAESALAFDAVVQELRGDSLLTTAAEARARIEGAYALRTATAAAFVGSAFAARTAELDAAISDYVTAVSEADTDAELDDALQGFADDLFGFAPLEGDADGLLGAMVDEDLELGASQQLVVKNAMVSAFSAGQTLSASIASVTATSSSTATFDGTGFGTGFLAANATFTTELASSLDLTSLTLPSVDLEALMTFATHLALSFSSTTVTTAN